MPLRGPHIARLTMIKKLLENKIIPSSQLGDPHECIFEYISLFHSKPCCYIDLKPFLFLIREDQVTPFLQRVSDFVDQLRAKYSDKKEKVMDVRWADIFYQRLRRGLGLHSKFSAIEKRQAVGYMIEMIDNCSDSELAAAAYAYIAASILWDLYAESGDVKALYELILLLEWVIKNHQSDQISAVILCKAYSSIGITTRVQRLIRGLDIKYIQKDTLGELLSFIFIIFVLSTKVLIKDYGECFC
ncbi:unnamed protein product [Thelazia callipaeda]|uniref:Rab-GAP TBC domain-containing protein n=1 Tax=Thelazia callipaeda TaxID=103827 RepID=A0A0N5CTM5_THECL|nr:unnamed protein product [Thelazia callipaeda]